MTFAEYTPAILSLALFALMTQIVGVIAGMWKTNRKLVPGSNPLPDYADPFYRTTRASANAIETMGIFAGVTIAAILAGADPTLVNALATASLVARFWMIVVHMAGLGKPDRSWRTLFFMVGWAAHAGLAGLTLFTLLG